MSNELEGLTDVLELLEASFGLLQPLAILDETPRKNLHQMAKHDTIRKISAEISNAEETVLQMLIHPSGEGLLLEQHPRLREIR